MKKPLSLFLIFRLFFSKTSAILGVVFGLIGLMMMFIFLTNTVAPHTEAIKLIVPAIMTLAFGTCSLFFIWQNAERVLKISHLFEKGKVTEGYFVEKKPTKQKANRQRLYDIFFEYESEGKTHTFSIRDTKDTPLNLEEAQLILFDPKETKNAIIMGLQPLLFKEELLDNLRIEEESTNLIYDDKNF